MSDYVKRRILSLHRSGLKVPRIAETLVLEDGIRISKQGIRKFLLRFSERGTIARKCQNNFYCVLRVINTSTVSYITSISMQTLFFTV